MGLKCSWLWHTLMMERGTMYNMSYLDDLNLQFCGSLWSACSCGSPYTDDWKPVDSGGLCHNALKVMSLMCTFSFWICVGGKVSYVWVQCSVYELWLLAF